MADLREGERYPVGILDVFDYQIDSETFQCGPLSIRRITNPQDQSRFDGWHANFKSNDHYQAYNAGISFDTQRRMEEEQRAFFHQPLYLE